MSEHRTPQTATPDARHLIIIGNGMAATRLLEECLSLASSAWRITVISAEAEPGYNRVLLSPVLGGEQNEASVITHDAEWYRSRGITLISGDAVVEIDRRRRVVRTASGREEVYQRLVLATGSQPRRIDCAGAELAGITTFRDLHDTRQLIDASRSVREAVVIGGGFLGIEAAEGLRRRGVSVTLLHSGRSLLNRQLDPEAGALLQKDLAKRGLHIVLQARTAAFLGNGRGQVRAVALEDGRKIAADLVVLAIGIIPDIRLARSAGLACRQGVLTDDTLQTYDPAIYAVGECVEHRHRTFGLVAPLYEQARVCAAHLMETGHRRYVYRDSPTRLKVSGVSVFAAGVQQGDSSLVWRDPVAGHYRRLWLEGNRLTGTVLYGETSGGAWYEKHLGKDITRWRNQLLFADRLPVSAAEEALV
ncbi:FAD-dependent oxidoreductase [Alcanivorax sp. JB21]|uniref:NAD(P)/FAD-dependent oxidoreductase n=1 Tax=Alcanivorax limicola TaxID=2874102 RepID=UPI001CBEA1D5|nr:FAD-dependent oxidoreductase [Alcanivorax limicola]MBZ2187785.1 FAD-dependent oxidoreductase [Alcanivorax limicola]